jgi:hypothetical protein
LIVLRHEFGEFLYDPCVNTEASDAGQSPGSISRRERRELDGTEGTAEGGAFAFVAFVVAKHFCSVILQ